jgi:HTH-type transcriptional regulator, transcriptional repressor of NAD biosynthesis genes
MNSTRHGLVIGKFYPPHEGHHLLISTAAAVCERVSVLVLSHEVESIPHALRVDWLRRIHAHETNVTFHGVIDDHPVNFEDSAIWDLHESVFRAGTAAITAEPVTAVFSSEPYGPELARRLNAVNVPVDPGRGLAPVSGTAIRADPVAHWHRMAPPVRGWFAKRVVIVGAESTGKTTLAADLAEALRPRGGVYGLTRWVPEYGRDFTVLKLAAGRAAAVLAGESPPEIEDLKWRTEDFVAIGERQNAIEDEAAEQGGPVLICDTDAFATAIWHERYMGSRSPEVEAVALDHPLYLLAHHDGVPFVSDGVRDEDDRRAWMTGRFEERLRETGRRFVALRGTRHQRMAQGLHAIDALLDEGWSMADPLLPENPTP